MNYGAGTHPLVRKLRAFFDLSDAEAEALCFPASAHQTLPAGKDLVAYGEPVAHGVLLEEGWAIRHRTLSDGRRQILGFVLAGDFCDPTVFVERRSHAAVTAITPARFTYVRADDICTLTNGSPKLSAALWWQSAYEHAATRAHMVALGRFTAYERLAYLLYQLAERLRLIGGTGSGSFWFPGTQQHLGDALGMTHVHVSRTLSRLQQDGVLTRHGSSDMQVHVKELQCVVELGSPSNYLRDRTNGFNFAAGILDPAV